jgi:hypothetical protein
VAEASTNEEWLKEVPPQQVASFGTTVIHAAMVREPWRLETEAFVIPTGPSGELEGGFARHLQKVAGSYWSRLEGDFRKQKTSAPFGPESPVAVPVKLPFTPARAAIFATGLKQTGRSHAGEAAAAVVRLTREMNLATLVLPLLGSGDAQVASPKATAEIMLSALHGAAVEGQLAHLKQVIITTFTKEAFDVLQKIGPRCA